ncbi:MAG TPA: carbon-nitrogen hydrolase family protein [Planctomycetota bacterium]|nr:carbon-nitrogen hydrolase family protein [Planctomycetota bacterium]
MKSLDWNWIRGRHIMAAFALVLLPQMGAAEPAPTPPPGAIPPQSLPGRPVRVAAIPIGFSGDHDKKLAMAIDILETAGLKGVDIACLPEEFAGCTAEPIPGPTTEAIAALARKHRMWIVCPIREQAGTEQYNTAVLLDREGKVAGYYRKVFVFWGEGLHASREGVKVFDTDFGRIAMLTCFDANFDEVWQEAERKGAEMVLWPSAYGGGTPLNGYAMIHNYFIVPVGMGNMIDCFGRPAQHVDKPRENLSITTFDLDVTIVHQDFNGEKVATLLREHAGEVEKVPEVAVAGENWIVLRATKPGRRVRDLCKQYHIETLREYRHRSREQINERRRKEERV